MTFQFCRGCAVQWPAVALVDGLCPACWEKEEEEKVHPSPQPASDAPPQRGEGEVEPPPIYETSVFKPLPRPCPSEFREKEEQVARDNLRGWRKRAVKTRCPACGEKRTLRKGSGLCKGCHGRWHRRGEPVNPDGTPDLTNLFQTMRGRPAAKPRKD